MKLVDFTVYCGPGTFWKCQVIIHPTKRDMIKARGGRACQAWCRQWADAYAFKTGINATIHFERKNITTSLIVHESAHVAIAYAGRCRLDFNTMQGDEAMADCMEHLVDNIRCKLKQNKVRFKN